MDRVTFDITPSQVFSDTPKRTISGLAVPLDATAEKGGKTWRFMRDSIEFGERTPLLQYHDPARPVGKLIKSEWTDRGLLVEFQVSKTIAGDECLELANDGVLGFSVGIDVPLGGFKAVGKELRVNKAFAAECSLTPTPAFVGSVVDSVSLSKEEVAVMPENTPAEETATPNTDLQTLVTQGIEAAFMSRPEVQPVPRVEMVKEESPYRFDGNPGQYGFVADFRAAHDGNQEAKKRLLTFAVSNADLSPGSQPGWNPGMAVTPLRETRRPLHDAVTSVSIPNGNPFTFPKWEMTGPTVAAHTEGVEPAVTGTITATNATVTPTAISSKAEITREAWLNSNPQVDAMVFANMRANASQAREAHLLGVLDALTGVGSIALGGVDEVLVDDLVDNLIDLQYEVGGERFTSLIAARPLFKALIQASDTSGRKLLPVLSPSNASGTTNAAFTSVQVGSTTAVPAWDLTSVNSYLLVPSSVYMFESPALELTFDLQIKSIYCGYFGFVASAVTRNSDVKRAVYTP